MQARFSVLIKHISQLLKHNKYVRTILLSLLCIPFLTACFGNETDSPVPMTAVGKELSETAEPAAAKAGESISFSHDSGIYRETRLTVTVTAPAGYTIAYTTDGTVPLPKDDSGLSVVSVSLEKGSEDYLIRHRELMIQPEFQKTVVYQNSELPSGRILSASLVDGEGHLSAPSSRVFFIGVDFETLFPNCLVLSILCDPADLLDYERGILVSGSVYDQWKSSEIGKQAIAKNSYWLIETNSTQRGKAWERPCTLQIYDGQDRPSAEVGAGIRIRGGASRKKGQKSFNFYFREQYGSDTLNYVLFEDLGPCSSFTLSNGGNTSEYMKFKNVLLQDLVADRHFLTLDSRPAILFINGEYWGPYILSPKLTAQTVCRYFKIEDEKSVVIVKAGEIEAGENEDIRLYDELMSFSKKDLSDPEIYRDFCEVMDVRSMADCFAARIYIGDSDWAPFKNDVLWRTRDASFNGGKWQYVLYDVEYSTGLYLQNKTSARANHLQRELEDYPLFAAAMKNPEFRELFCDSIKEIGAKNYSADRVERRIMEYSELWDPLMPDYYKRFGDSSHLWNEDKQGTISFFRERYDYMLSFLDQTHSDPGLFPQS